MKRSNILLFCFCLSVFGPTQAEPEPSSTVFSGFGSIGFAYNPNENHGFVRDIGQHSETGRKLSFRNDTLLGLQVAHAINPQWQLFGQLRLRDQAENTLNNAIARAFVSWRPLPSVHIRAGRMADATFLMSDYTEVGYAFPWIRPPHESYGIMAVRSYDGVDVTYSIPHTGGVWRIKAMGGRIEVPLPFQPPVKTYNLQADDLWGLALIHERGPLKARVGYTSFHLKHPSTGAPLVLPSLNALIGNPLVGAFFPAVVNEAQALRDQFLVPSTRVSFASAGFAYDDGRWMLQGEISQLASPTTEVPRGMQGYLSAGYHFGDFLPYVMVSGSRSGSPKRAQADWSGVPDGPLLQTQTLAIVNAHRAAQTTFSTGLRWDIHSQAALKFQLDHIRVRDQGWGIWSAGANHDTRGASVNVLSASLDFVF